jgi:hypothetical protein
MFLYITDIAYQNSFDMKKNIMAEMIVYLSETSELSPDEILISRTQKWTTTQP